MNLDFSKLFSHGSETGSTDKSVATGQTAATSESARNYALASEIREMTVGSKITGEVVSIQGNEVQIAVDKDLILLARLEKSMNLSVGQSLTFEVQGNNGSQVSLRPLYANLAMGSTISKALQAASLPATETAVQMVQNMMQDGMPVDKNSLLSMYRQVMDNPALSGQTIVRMNRLQIPVTPENVVQFEAYQNYEHQMVGSIEKVADNLQKMFESMAAQGEDSQLTSTFKNVLSIFTQEMGNLTEISGSIPKDQVTQAAQIIPETQTAQIIPETQLTQTTQTMEGLPMMTSEGPETGGVPNSAILSSQTGGTAMDSYVQVLTQLGVSEEVATEIAKGNVPPREALQILNEAILTAPAFQGEGFDKNILHELIASLSKEKGFQGLLKQGIMAEWLLKPEEVGTEGKVEEFYRNLQQQTAKLANVLTDVAREGTQLYRDVTNIRDNVEFMNQLNQMFTYVQLPLKMRRQNAHGDLYVYTNKKNLAEKQGKVSALLHLDMDSLGPVDVFVELDKNNVRTKFYLQSEDLMDFLEKHMHQLDERIEKKGYQVTSEVVKKDSGDGKKPEKTGFEKMIEETVGNGIMISKTSFDVRT